MTPRQQAALQVYHVDRLAADKGLDIVGSYFTSRWLASTVAQDLCGVVRQLGARKLLPGEQVPRNRNSSARVTLLNP